MSLSRDPALRMSKTETLRRFWYPIVPISLLAVGPRSVGLFGEDMVIWQDNAGTVSALEERCSHQAVRLSLAAFRDNRPACAQHRWKFDGSGRCTRIAATRAGGR